MPGIGTLQERSLHAALKDWYTLPGDCIEKQINGYSIDIARGDLLLEIQTGSFSSIRRKLEALLPTYKICLIHPIAVTKWITYQPQDEQEAPQRRKSPRKGRKEDLFRQLVYLPHLVPHPNFSLELVMVEETEIRARDGLGSWRRKGNSIKDHLLETVLEVVRFEGPASYHQFLPAQCAQAPFTINELAKSCAVPPWLTRKMVYSLVRIGLLQPAGKKGRSILYEKMPEPPPTP